VFSDAELVEYEFFKIHLKRAVASTEYVSKLLWRALRVCPNGFSAYSVCDSATGGRTECAQKLLGYTLSARQSGLGAH